jgi:hypothetical protein
MLTYTILKKIGYPPLPPEDPQGEHLHPHHPLPDHDQRKDLPSPHAHHLLPHPHHPARGEHVREKHQGRGEGPEQLPGEHDAREPPAVALLAERIAVSRYPLAGGTHYEQVK